jgi:hypothetical protein
MKLTLGHRVDLKIRLTEKSDFVDRQGSDDEVRFWPDGLAINTYMAIVWATHEIGNKC